MCVHLCRMQNGVEGHFFFKKRHFFNDSRIMLQYSCFLKVEKHSCSTYYLALKMEDVLHASSITIVIIFRHRFHILLIHLRQFYFKSSVICNFSYHALVKHVGKYCLTIVKFVAENEKCASTSGRIIAANISKHCFPKRFIILNYFITKNELFFVFHTMLF